MYFLTPLIENKISPKIVLQAGILKPLRCTTVFGALCWIKYAKTLSKTYPEPFPPHYFLGTSRNCDYSDKSVTENINTLFRCLIHLV